MEQIIEGKNKIAIGFCMLMILLTPGYVRSQELKEYPVEKFSKTILEVEAPKDTVVSYLFSYFGPKTKKIGMDQYEIFDNSQAFITVETYNQVTKKGRSPAALLYDEERSLGSIWNVSVKSDNAGKTLLEFQMKKAVVDPSHREQQDIWEKGYQNRTLVSRGIIEEVLKINIRKRMLPKIVSVAFSEENGYDNGNYSYKSLRPIAKVKAAVVLNKKVSDVEAETVSEGFLVYDRNKSSLKLFDLQQKKMVWERKLDNSDDQNNNTFTMYKNTIYTATGNGSLYAISLSSGTVFWTTIPNPERIEKGKNQFFGQSLPISDDFVYANYHGMVYKINRFNGEVVWGQTIGNYGSYNYSFDENYVYKGGVMEFFQIDKKNGAIKKMINDTYESTFYNPHLLDGNRLYMTSGNLYAYDLQTDKILWKSEGAHYILKDEVKPVLYVNTFEANLKALDKNTGNLQWEIKNDEKKEHEGKTVLNVIQSSNEIIMDIEIENYSLKTKRRQIVFVNKTDGKVNKVVDPTERIISNMVLKKNTLSLLTTEGLLNIDLITKAISTKKMDLSSLGASGDLRYDYYFEMWTK